MGAELSKNIESAPPSSLSQSINGMRRVGSSGALDKKKASPEFPTSASTTSLMTMGLGSAPASMDTRGGNGSFLSGGAFASNGTQRNSMHNSSNSSASGHKSNKLLDNALFSSMRRSSNSRAGGGSNSPDTGSVSGVPLGGEDQAVESLDLPIVEWEGYVTKRGHLVRNWKNRFFTLEGNNLSCTSGICFVHSTRFVFFLVLRDD